MAAEELTALLEEVEAKRPHPIPPGAVPTPTLEYRRTSQSGGYAGQTTRLADIDTEQLDAGTAQDVEQGSSVQGLRRPHPLAQICCATRLR